MVNWWVTRITGPPSTGQLATQRSRLTPAGVVEVALSGAVVDAEAGRIAGAGRQCMPQHQHAAGLGQFRQRHCAGDCIAADCHGQDTQNAN